MVGRLKSWSLTRSRSEHDTAPLTAWHISRAPKNIAKVVFFYVSLVLFKVCLTAAIRINRVTFMDFDFHCRAVELLHQIRALLGLKDAR